MFTKSEQRHINVIIFVSSGTGKTKRHTIAAAVTKTPEYIRAKINSETVFSLFPFTTNRRMEYVSKPNSANRKKNNVYDCANENRPKASGETDDATKRMP
jgi:hypothetical protein